MTSDKLSSLTRTAPVLSLLVVAAILFAAPLATAPQTAATTTRTAEEQDDEDRIEDTIDIATEFLEQGDKQIGNIIFTPRWSGVSWVDPDSLGVIFADCLPEEFGVSAQKILGGPELTVLESYAVALPEDFMVWIMIVRNEHETDRLPAAAGVICASDEDIDEQNPASTIILRPEVKQRINNVIKQFINIENNQIVNLNNIITTYNSIVQQAINIAINSTNVTQNINQTAQIIDNQTATAIVDTAIANTIVNTTLPTLPPTTDEDTIDEDTTDEDTTGNATGTTLPTLPPTTDEDTTGNATGNATGT
jgi:hypothetical protein